MPRRNRIGRVPALEMAVAQRRPARGVIHHSDHGSQYTALLFTGRCEQAGISISIGSVGDCFDNAVGESFHASLKKELIPPPAVADPRRGALGDLPVHRGVVQPATAALHARVPLTRRLRAGAQGDDRRHGDDARRAHNRARRPSAGRQLTLTARARYEPSGVASDAR